MVTQYHRHWHTSDEYCSSQPLDYDSSDTGSEDECDDSGRVHIGARRTSEGADESSCCEGGCCAFCLLTVAIACCEPVECRKGPLACALFLYLIGTLTVIGTVRDALEANDVGRHIPWRNARDEMTHSKAQRSFVRSGP